MEALDKFTNLEELVLDNNDIDDTITFPPMPKLHTLLINKNKISLSFAIWFSNCKVKLWKMEDRKPAYIKIQYLLLVEG